MGRIRDAAARGVAVAGAAAVVVCLAVSVAAGSTPAEPVDTVASLPSPQLSRIELRPVSGDSLRPVTQPTPAVVAAPAPPAPDLIAAAVEVAEQDAAEQQPTPEGFDPASYRPGASLHTREVLALVVKYFPVDQIGNAMAVSRCESGHSNAIGAVNRNGTRDWGVFQLNDGGTLQAALRRIGVSFDNTRQAQQLALDADTNVRAARAIFDSRRWSPWTCSAKTGIVAGLYSRTAGPMDGKYDERGLPGSVDLTRTAPAADTMLPVPEVPAPSPTAEPAPTTPAPTPVTPTPTSPAPTPTAVTPAPTTAGTPAPAATPAPAPPGGPAPTKAPASVAPGPATQDPAPTGTAPRD